MFRLRNYIFLILILIIIILLINNLRNSTTECNVLPNSVEEISNSVAPVIEPVMKKMARWSRQLSYSNQLIELHRESIKGQFLNNPMEALKISKETWPWWDTLQPYNFDLCMRRFAREFHADPVLRDRKYPVPFSIFSRNTTIFMTLFYSMKLGNYIPNYQKWFANYEWKVKFNEKWAKCSTIKGEKGKGDMAMYVLGVECISVVSTR